MDGASPEKILLIANPASRHGEGIVDAARVEALLHERADAELTVLMTQRRGHAEELAAAAGGFDLVVVVGTPPEPDDLAATVDRYVAMTRATGDLVILTP